MPVKMDTVFLSGSEISVKIETVFLNSCSEFC